MPLTIGEMQKRNDVAHGKPVVHEGVPLTVFPPVATESSVFGVQQGINAQLTKFHGRGRASSREYNESEELARRLQLLQQESMASIVARVTIDLPAGINWPGLSALTPGLTFTGQSMTITIDVASGGLSAGFADGIARLRINPAHILGTTDDTNTHEWYERHPQGEEAQQTEQFSIDAGLVRSVQLAQMPIIEPRRMGMGRFYNRGNVAPDQPRRSRPIGWGLVKNVV